MAISLKHTFQSAKSDGADTTLVQPSNWNAEHIITAAAGKVLGRDTSGAGAVQELPIAVDTAGNVGIGTNTPKTGLDVAGQGVLIEHNAIFSSNLYYDGGWKYRGNGYAGSIKLAGADGSVTIQTAPNNTGGAGAAATPSERMRIDSTGVVLVGTASATGIYNGSSFNSGVAVEQVGSISAQRNNGPCLWLSKATGYTESTFINFSVSALGKGSIYYNSGTGQVVYAVTSDYRAKDILGPVQDSGATIDALKVYTGKMHGAAMPYPMMVAHEVQEVVPFAVSGEKDAVNEDDTPKYQQMDHAILVPLLIAELQSIRARLAALEARP